jgi:NDP-sugar pyrophosphorylase family protein
MPNTVYLDSIEEISKAFMPAERGPAGVDAYPSMTPYLRAGVYRALHANEIATLVKNNNSAENWAEVFVTGTFNPNLVANCEFYGRVLIGDLAPKLLEYHDLRLPVGIRNCTIMSCRIGDNVAIRDVHYLAHYVIGSNCILFNVDEMLCTNHAKFGNGIVKEGEDEAVRIWLEVANENGGRRILPFEGLLPADAFLWARHRADPRFLERLVDITEARFSRRRGFLGEVGDRTVIKDCQILKDVRIGTDAYVKGANKLKNITILSSAAEPTQIGEGVELVNGIVGHGNRIFYEAKAIRFVTGRNVQLKYGARLLNSVIGDNSTVSCCEMLNSLIFPFHEQHHNNSFLIAATVMGQSNIAAGATIGSNHNSRAPDGEIVAGRGFWPGLCTDFKHNSRFASFTLAARGSYSDELDIRYPFSMIWRDRRDGPVHIMPAYWFVHNMYAMARNAWKFATRDGRAVKDQHVELDFLAPDTVQEILAAMGRLEALAARAAAPHGRTADAQLAERGRAILAGPRADELALADPEAMKRFGGTVEKPARGWKQYRDICVYFGVRTLIDFFAVDERTTLESFVDMARGLAQRFNHEQWVNCGGQVMAEADLDTLRADIASGKLPGWDAVHERYDELWAGYPKARARFALWAVAQALGLDTAALGPREWKPLLKSAQAIFAAVCESAWSSRRKDYEDPFRKMLYESDEEMIAVLGKIDDNAFLNDLSRQTKRYTDVLGALSR